MSRVMHWIQNRSLAHYPTDIDRQLWMPPWAELAVLHLQLLFGNDRLVNLVQWFTMVGSVLGVSLLARQLGASLRGQILAAIFCLTIPMGILQATSTQTDYATAFWGVCLAFYVLQAHKRGLRNDEWVLLSLATGLGVLTKGTFVAFAFPLFGWLLISTVQNLGWKSTLGYALLGAIISLLLNVGAWGRNLQTYQYPIGNPDFVGRLSNDSPGFSPLISNTLRNLTTHLATPSHEVNASLQALVESIHKVLNLDPDDARTSLGDYEVRWIGLWRHEDFAGNPIHLLLVPITILALARYRTGTRKMREERVEEGLAEERDSHNGESILLTRKFAPWIYAFLVICGWLLFSALFKWQLFNIRLHLPFFVLWSPVAGLALDFNRPNWLSPIIAGALLVSGLPYLLFNSSRPLLSWEPSNISSVFQVPREQLLFASASIYRTGYFQVTEAVKSTQCRDIGLHISSREPEYPYWILLASPTEDLRLEYVAPDPPLDRYIAPDFQPCAVICTAACSDPSPFPGLELSEIYDDFIHLYLPSNPIE
jgi:4-amino-4-deoxy-L-arabinose transferase-like glycosyltransferase